jgi:hypothetical protein
MSVPALICRIASDGIMPEDRARPNTGLPWILIHEEEFPTRAAATARERYFKTGRGRDELDKLYR